MRLFLSDYLLWSIYCKKSIFISTLQDFDFFFKSADQTPQTPQTEACTFSCLKALLLSEGWPSCLLNAAFIEWIESSVECKLHEKRSISLFCGFL